MSEPLFNQPASSYENVKWNRLPKDTLIILLKWPKYSPSFAAFLRLTLLASKEGHQTCLCLLLHFG